MHLDEEQIQRLMHGELSQAGETSARGHLTRCTDCRGLVAEAEREESEVFSMLRVLDDAPPQVDVNAVIETADSALAGAGGSKTGDAGWHRWAAGILVALGIAGASYAVPGSPVPALVHTLAAWIGGRPDPASRTPAPMEPQHAGTGGIAVVPGREFLILFTTPQTEGRVRVTLTDGAEVSVHAPVGAATYNSEVERLVIDNQGSSATFEIQIPRHASRVEIRVNDRRIFLKDGPHVTPQAATHAPGSYVLPLTSTGS